MKLDQAGPAAVRWQTGGRWWTRCDARIWARCYCLIGVEQLCGSRIRAVAQRSCKRAGNRLHGTLTWNMSTGSMARRPTPSCVFEGPGRPRGRSRTRGGWRSVYDLMGRNDRPVKAGTWRFKRDHLHTNDVGEAKGCQLAQCAGRRLARRQQYTTYISGDRR